ncbi:SGNH/GDSL hydrolase family protein [Microbacterium sp. NPDC056569]|uniref:SGNH/GDSL hydrolase family protein n=1 Tax=Microbacterium sp. NPDC056569 TaxID=3345867 RepID=UPI00366C0034
MKRRILAAFAALALGVVAVFGTSSAAVAAHTPGATYVALGDSEAAGSGNMPYVDTSSCKQSKKAYPKVLSAALGVSVVSAACAGATTQDVAVQAGALHAAGALGSATQLVTITAGVNDIEWQKVLALCSDPNLAAECAAAKAAAIAEIPTIAPAIAQLIGFVRSLAPNAYIVVTGYPLLFGDVTGTCNAGSSQSGPVKLPAQLVAEVNQGVSGINAFIAGGVAAYMAAVPADIGVEYVDVSVAFDGHGLCDTGDRWIFGFSAGEPNIDRGFHANAAGQQAWAATIQAALVG